MVARKFPFQRISSTWSFENSLDFGTRLAWDRGVGGQLLLWLRHFSVLATHFRFASSAFGLRSQALGVVDNRQICLRLPLLSNHQLSLLANRVFHQRISIWGVTSIEEFKTSSWRVNESVSHFLYQSRDRSPSDTFAHRSLHFFFTLLRLSPILSDLVKPRPHFAETLYISLGQTLWFREALLSDPNACNLVVIYLIVPFEWQVVPQIPFISHTYELLISAWFTNTISKTRVESSLKAPKRHANLNSLQGQ